MTNSSQNSESNESLLQEPATKSVKLLYFYDRADQQFKERLEKQLSYLKRQQLISSWSNQDIDPGKEPNTEIEKQLQQADIILLLISSDFIASKYCVSQGIAQALARHDSKEATVIPIILRPVHWQDMPFGRLSALPSQGKPVVSSNWYAQDEAFFDIAEGIRKIIELQYGLSSIPIGQNTPSIDLFMPKAEKAGAAHAHISTPISFSSQYWRDSKTHGCDVNFRLSQDHHLKYIFNWNPVTGDFCTLFLDGSKILKKSKVFGIQYMEEAFRIKPEDTTGTFSYFHRDNHFIIIVKVGETIVFEQKDIWNRKS